MSKNILIITGSPNREGNSTRMAGAFARGAQQAGHTVTTFETAFHHMRGFTATEADDFAALAQHINQADVLLIATPLYWFSFPAQVKAAIDQLDYSDGSRMTGKESYLFVSGGDESAQTYAPIESLYGAIAGYMRWMDKGMLQARGLDAAGALEASGLLKEAEALGQNA